MSIASKQDRLIICQFISVSVLLQEEDIAVLKQKLKMQQEKYETELDRKVRALHYTSG